VAVPARLSKAQEGAPPTGGGRGWAAALGALLGWLPAERREFILKDARLFFRDPTQWSQLILLGVLVVVYLFNIQALPVFSGEQVPPTVVTLVVFLNLGLAGFVLAAIAARFLFPSVSLEGRQMWLLRSSPLDLRSMLWSKYWIGTVPLLVLALVITTVTNLILRASPFMTLVSEATMVLFTLAASALALSFGAFYPRFDTENAAQIPTSFGGLVFMMSAILLLAAIIVVEAGPVSAHLDRAQAGGDDSPFTPGLCWAVAKVFGLCTLATLAPLERSLRRLKALEL
jgi:ABC-2 type transport system permease protein